MVGAPVATVCFANGRDLMLTYGNNLVEIECQNYLPLNVMQQMLLMDNVENVEPENPVKSRIRREKPTNPFDPRLSLAEVGRSGECTFFVSLG